MPPPSPTKMMNNTLTIMQILYGFLILMHGHILIEIKLIVKHLNLQRAGLFI